MGLGIAKHELRMLALLLSGAFLTVLNATLLTPALPAIMGDLAIEPTTAQWLTSGYALTEAVVIPLAAYLMGRFTTRRLFIGGMALFGCGSLLAVLAPAFPALLAGRVMQACATGFIMPMVFSVVLLVIPRERRGSAIGVVSLIVGFAPTIGPSLSGVLVDTAGWRAIFVIVTALSAAIVAFAAKDLQPYGSPNRSKFDAPSVALSTLGLVGLLYGLSSFSSSDNLTATAALTAAGLVLVGAYAWRQLHLDDPMLRLDILKVPQYRITIIIVALIQTGLIGLQTIMPLYIQGTLGKSAAASGMALLPGAVIGAFAALFAGRMFDKLGVRRPTLIGTAVFAAGAACFPFLCGDSPIALVTAAYAVLAAGIQFASAPVNTWAINTLPNDAIQHAQSTGNTINQIAGSFGTALLVSVAAAASNASQGAAVTQAAFAGYHAAFCVTAALMACAIVLTVLLVRDRKPAGR
ncbi:DHA2 family efflux MFS transporter permease subunit [uncultured Senegalimassilia sp.]|uniref:DHA2 family efflux MFS transporter permease subunit n=1 Tax=uncultured Senegalimassilia sp. TaxID=1714350 RepID=UPI0025D2C4E2|nr:DHA2 family efflux MFS transporter permease subunit [uncultured Senegalimassilia sp.]